MSSAKTNFVKEAGQKYSESLEGLHALNVDDPEFKTKSKKLKALQKQGDTLFKKAKE